jgi:hypothetical protein
LICVRSIVRRAAVAPQQTGGPVLEIETRGT